MILNMLKAKIRRATVTHAELDNESSCATDRTLLPAAEILQYKQIHIYNIANRERFVTRAIRAEAGSGIISINGAAAHKSSPGDLQINAACGRIDASNAAGHNPRLVYPDGDNRIARIAGEIPVQAA